MQGESSVGKQRRRTNKVCIRNLPPYVREDEVRAMCSKFGNTLRIDQDHNGQFIMFIVTFESPDSASDACNNMDGQDFQGQNIKVSPIFGNIRDRIDNANVNGRPPHMGPPPQGPPHGGPLHGGSGLHGGPHGPPPPPPPGSNGPIDPRKRRLNPPRRDNYPLLRILVNSDLVGAVIGTKGSTITDITQRTKARVDVLRQDKHNRIRVPETPIYIYGSPDNVSAACKEVMKVLQKESQEKLKEDFVLKMLAEDKYCGSIIGRGGKNIKSVREKTETKITISQQNPHYPFNWDRIITTKGTIDNMSKAEREITGRLRQCFVNERQNSEFNTMGVPPNIHPMGMMPPGPGGPGMYNMPQGYPAVPPNMIGGYGGGYPNMNQDMMRGPSDEEETYIKVPDGAASLIIGQKGNNIRHIKNQSRAYIHVDPERNKNDKNDPTPPRIPDGIPIPRDPKERIVTIRGSRESQWKAHFYVFEKLKSEGFAGNDEVKLICLMKVPDTCVGRIIGKGGYHVKDIQKKTGAIVKLPDDTMYAPPPPDFKFVEITGSYTATQAAMSRIRDKIPSGPGGNNGGPGLMLQQGGPRHGGPLIVRNGGGGGRPIPQQNGNK